ncbi:MAG: DUF4079 domain-containing protein [Trichocoleus desertorum ATA4-8-CV12]|nr:DUF4079 domain-containing protein [Trichocoleus desertorum ATA4-8-CV12]
MNLPSFLWLWRIAAWSMGFSLLAYVLLAMTGVWMSQVRSTGQPHPNWLRSLHYTLGRILGLLVLLLLGIGLVGTVGHYGSLGHSIHLPAGLIVVALVAISFWSATQINPERSWARSLHISTNLILFLGFIWVSVTGWDVVQKYLP